MSQIVIISGSPTPGSRLNGLIGYVESKLQEAGLAVDHIRVTDLPAEALLHAKWDDSVIKAALARVEEAAAVVIASPVYKANITGVLKAFLDLLPQTGLKGKATLPLFIGGTIAHLLSLDYAVKPLLSVLGSRTILAGVFAVDQWVTRREDGGFDLSEELQERLARAAQELVDEVNWLGVRAREQEKTAT